MQILSVHLKNFKIHQDQLFEFAPGINAICGENGAGKTSILEGIAWALFDHSDYANEELIRVGSPQAEVAVQFVSDWDGRTYEVRRTVSSKTTTYRLYDLALHQQLEYERKAEVQQWLRQHLGISPGTDLAYLFRTVIGVPQGTLTLDFLKSPGERKKVFDAMIKVEEYKATADQCKDLEKYASDQVTATSHQIELLQVELQQWDPCCQQLEQIDQTIRTQTQELHQAQREQERLEQEWQGLSEIAEHIRQTEATVQQYQREVSLTEYKLQQMQERLAQAEEAQATVLACQADFERYQALEADLVRLQEQASHRQGLHQQRDRLVAAERTLEQDLTRLQTLLERWQALAAELPTLEAQAREQAHLEEYLATLQTQRQLRQHLEQQLQLELTQLQGSRTQAEHLIQALEQAQQAAQTLIQHQQGYERYRQAEQHLAQIQARMQQRQEIRQLWQQQRDRLSDRQRQEAKLQASYQRRHDLARQIEQLHPQVEQQTQWEQRLQELQERVQQAQVLRQRLGDAQERHKHLHQEQERIEEQIHSLSDLLPLLAEIPSLEAHQERLRTQLGRWQAAREFAAELAQILDTAQQHRRHLGSQYPCWQDLLRQYPDLHQWIQATWQSFEMTLGSLEQILAEIYTQADPDLLEQQLAQVGCQLATAYQARQRTAPLEAWQQQAQAIAQELAHLTSSIDDLTWQLDSDTSTRQHLQELHARLQSLGDPRSHLARCQQEYAATAHLDQEWQALQAELQDIQGSLVDLEQQLAQFQDLEQAQAQWQQLYQESQPSYQAYVQCQALAVTLPERQQQVQQIQEHLQTLEHALAQRQTLLEEHCHTWGGDLAQAIATAQAQLKALGDPRQQIQRLEAELRQRPQVREQYALLEEQRRHTQAQRQTIEAELQATAHLDQAIIAVQKEISQCRPSYTRYLQAQPLAAQLPHLQADHHQILAELSTQRHLLQQGHTALAQLQVRFDPERYGVLAQARPELALHIARLQTSLQALVPQRQELADRLAYLQTRHQEKQQQEARLVAQKRLQTLIKFIRGVYRDAGPRLASLFLQNINHTADALFREILNRPDVSLTWTADYDIVVQEGASRRRFAMLSGGEQMTAALAVRLALLKTLEDISVAFFDEPTTNMDQQRRRNLAESLGRIRSFTQLFVISHDDSFETLTGKVIHVNRP